MMIQTFIKGLTLALLVSLAGTSLAQKAKSSTLTKAQLLNKIKGGWAGQTIGTTYGWTNEFQYAGTYIQDYERIPWHNDYINEAMRVFPGLYDDVYMDLMFMHVFEKKGLDAPMEEFAKAFADTEFQLWHANQAGRYNVQNGVPADRAGHWLNNPHADDIDFQIEADFAGLMSPGMPQAATDISERIGKIVNSGDGLYGGVFVANMYSWAFVSDDIPTVVNNALKSIPKESKFHQLISDVIKWHKQYPKDWKQTWFLIQRNWAEEVGCPSMVFHPLNIDAKINAAYVVMGLLYGEGDYTKTIEIATRTGQDSDCNPATALGILGTMIGYDKIPPLWMEPLQKAEDKKFSHSEYALNDVYKVGLQQALENIERNGGTIAGEQITLPKASIKTAAFEENFKGHFPKERIKLEKIITDTISFEFEGIGFVLRGASRSSNANDTAPVIAELYIDGKRVETANLPWQANKARADLFWRYQLPKGKHQVTIKVKQATKAQDLWIADYLVYDNVKTSGIRIGGQHDHH
ncbi:ADP-ribosylglycohydrolase family protein [Sphingobacterium sp. SYP-B4668]|uniref:ADP-ribosylglycohydrolase family protein n=1 Tax=Sphingobacterium sp. SYP-B4668 TaxID=2996035 RepID=UPI0022DD9222|nr:ADP-ribosylglycohydrolase family protein [Sphingobacterium sp. SYP-B4668]